MDFDELPDFLNRRITPRPPCTAEDRAAFLARCGGHVETPADRFEQRRLEIIADRKEEARQRIAKMLEKKADKEAAAASDARIMAQYINA